MRLKSIRLKNFKAFDFAGITDLSVDFTSSIQLGLGTNGSGKSSYLRQLSPYPVAKSVFNKNGYKELVIEHHGHTYNLISDFSEKSHPHSFTIDGGTELNEGGGTSVQTSLIEEYFDLDKEKEKLLFGDINVTAMGPAQRKAFLLKSSPLQLGFMIDRQKTLLRKLRSTKDELKANSRRESELLDMLMTPEDLETLHNEISTIDQQLQDVVKQKGALNERRDTQKQRLETLSQIGITSNEVESYVQRKTSLANREALFKSQHDSFVPDEKCFKEAQETRIQIQTSIGSYNDRLEEICGNLRNVEEQLEKTDGRQFAELEQQKVSLLKDKDAIESQLKQSSFSLEGLDSFTSSEVNSLSDVLQDLEVVLSPLHNITRPLISRDEYRQKQQDGNQLSYSINRHKERLEILDREIKEIKDAIDRSYNLDSVEPCAKNACPLYSHVMSKRSEREDKLSSLVKEQEDEYKAKSEDEKALEEISEELRELEPAMASLTALQKLTERAPVLTRYIGADILQKLSNSPLWLSNQISKDVSYSQGYLQLEHINEDLSRIEERLKDQKSISADFREIQLKEKEKLDKAFSEITQKKVDEKKKLEEVISFITLNETYFQIQDEGKALIEEGKYVEEYKKITEALSEIQRAIGENDYKFSSLTSEKGSLDHTLGEQNKLRGQYEGEIKRRKDELVLMQKDLASAEEALKSLLDDSVRGWLKGLVDQVNKYIASVFTYRLEVKVPSGAIDFTFSMKAKDTDVPDIGMGSAAQQEMINIAFCLALRDEFKMYDYPLFLDETGKTFDSTHQFKIIGLLNTLVQEKFVSQLVLINHHAAIHGGLNNVQTLVLNSENIDLPPSYNEGINIE